MAPSDTDENDEDAADPFDREELNEDGASESSESEGESNFLDVNIYDDYAAMLLESHPYSIPNKTDENNEDAADPFDREELHEDGASESSESEGESNFLDVYIYDDYAAMLLESHPYSIPNKTDENDEDAADPFDREELNEDGASESSESEGESNFLDVNIYDDYAAMLLESHPYSIPNNTDENNEDAADPFDREKLNEDGASESSESEGESNFLHVNIYDDYAAMLLESHPYSIPNNLVYQMDEAEAASSQIDLNAEIAEVLGISVI